MSGVVKQPNGWWRVDTDGHPSLLLSPEEWEACRCHIHGLPMPEGYSIEELANGDRVLTGPT